MSRFCADNGAEAMALLKDAGVQFVHLGLFDEFAVFRERRIPLQHVHHAFEGKLCFPNVLLRWDAADNLIEDAAISPEPLSIDLTSGRLYPFEDKAALFVADYDGPSSQSSPRSVLASQVDRCTAMGFEAQVAFEFELIFLDETDVSLREDGFLNPTPIAQDNKCWSGISAAWHAGLLGELERLLAQADIPLYCLGLELGPGCVEATLDHCAPMRAADNAALFKGFTKAFARQKDLTAAFMAKLGDNYPGLSGHIHLSLWDRKTKTPAFHDSRSAQGISETMYHFIAGVTGLLPEAMVMSNHTVNSYRRLMPGTWAPRTASWGIDNYTTAVRAVSADPETTRLEYRISGSDTHPHLALALVLGAGLWGIENRMKPPAPSLHDAREAAVDSSARLPRTLLEAAERFLESEMARQIFGDQFVDRFGQARVYEDIALRGHVSARERARYLETV